MIIDVLECSSDLIYHDSIPRVGRVTCVTRVGSPPFVVGLVWPGTQARFIWRDVYVNETL
jgi:hypothetical protein